MEKKWLSTLLFCFAFGVSYGLETTFNSNNAFNPLADECTAPPPDSFRVIERTTHSLTLAWASTGPGLDYHLTVWEETPTGLWSLLYTYTSINAPVKKVEPLKSGRKYRFKLATKCNNGEPSINVAVIDDSTLVLELTLGGRKPIEPKPIPDCGWVNYKLPENEWVGYKITHTQGEQTIVNYFEFVTSEENGGSNPQLRRQTLNSFLVAANYSGDYPNINVGIALVQEDEYVVMNRITSNGLIPFGYVDISSDPSHSIVQFCRANTWPWDNNYHFEPLKAASAEAVIPFNNLVRPQISEEQGQITVVNPFSENLKLFFNQSDDEGSAVSNSILQVIDIQGDILHSSSVNCNFLEISTQGWAKGCYIIRFKQNNHLESIKVIKI